MPDITLPTPGPGGTPGPQYAEMINTAIDSVNDVIETGRLSETELSTANLTQARRQGALAAMPALREQARRLKASATVAWRNAESWNVRAMTKQGRRLVYVLQSTSAGAKVGYSDNDGATRPTEVKQFTGAAEGIVKDLLVTSDGEVLIVLSAATGPYQAVIYRSMGFDANPATATWAKVFTTPAAQGATAPLQQYSGLTHDGVDTVAGAWYDAKTNSGGTIYGDNAGVRVRLSLDRGVTWAVVFNLRTWLIENGIPNPDANTVGFHVHGIEYDPYSDGWVLSYGDTDSVLGQAGILHFSKDFTVITPLYRGQSWQAVGLVALPDCILLGGDGGNRGGLNRIPRRADGSFGPPEQAYLLTDGIGNADNRPEVGAPVLWCHTQISGTTPRSRLLLTADGYIIHELVVDSGYVVSSTNGLQFVVGPTATGKFIASSANDGRYSSASPASTWSELVVTPA